MTGFLTSLRHRADRLRHKTWRIGAVVFLAGLLVLLAGISYPAKPYFDEIHYVPAARQMLGHGVVLNREHPPLAKELMAVGIAIFGDGPVGWRFMSALFGALSLTGIYVWARLLFGRESAALWAAGVTLVNQLLYVQSRIAMLDVFVLAFMLWAMAAFTATWSGRHVRRWFMATGVLLGLAVACKWSGLPVWAMVVGIVVLVKTLQRWKTRFEDPRQSDWYRPDLWSDMTVAHWFASLVVIPAVVYYLSCAPIDGLDPIGFLARQGEMARLLASAAGPHPYASLWTDWPLIRRPIWYLFESEPANSGAIEAVVFLGNPIVLWGGIPALLLCLWRWSAARRADVFLILAAWLATYLCWAVVTKTSFAYYYLPAGTVLSLALTHAFYEPPLAAWVWARRLFLLSAFAMLVYLLPISSASVTVTLAGYNQRMWFLSWR
jgi:dolichyl-phosphate-mannose--protein O-mannosyl transferase